MAMYVTSNSEVRYAGLTALATSLVPLTRIDRELGSAEGPMDYTQCGELARGAHSMLYYATLSGWR
jgi:hypothetical protein